MGDQQPAKCMTVVEYQGFDPMIKAMDCVDNWQNQVFTTPLACSPGQIYWKKDPTLCIDAVHPELVQLRSCNGLESQMFAMQDQKDYVDAVTNEGFLVGTGTTKDLCFNFLEDGAVHFGECSETTSTKFQFQD